MSHETKDIKPILNILHDVVTYKMRTYNSEMSRLGAGLDIVGAAIKKATDTTSDEVLIHDNINTDPEKILANIQHDAHAVEQNKVGKTINELITLVRSDIQYARDFDTLHMNIVAGPRMEQLLIQGHDTLGKIKGLQRMRNDAREQHNNTLAVDCVNKINHLCTLYDNMGIEFKGWNQRSLRIHQLSSDALKLIAPLDTKNKEFNQCLARSTMILKSAAAIQKYRQQKRK